MAVFTAVIVASYNLNSLFLSAVFYVMQEHNAYHSHSSFFLGFFSIVIMS